MRAELPVVFGDDLLEQRDRFHRVLARLLARRLEAVVDGQAEHRLRFEIVRIRGDQLAQRRRCRSASAASLLPGARRAACDFDVEPLARRHRVAQRHRLGDRFARADLRVERGAAGRARHRRVGARPRRPRRAGRRRRCRIAQQLERGTVVAGRAQRDAPVGHRHVLVELERLRAGPLRFLEPERVNLRDALQEELARVFGRRRDREILGDAHARQQLGRQQRLRAGRHDAHVRLRLLAPVFPWPRGPADVTAASSDDEAETGDVLHGAKYSSGRGEPTGKRLSVGTTFGDKTLSGAAGAASRPGSRAGPPGCCGTRDRPTESPPASTSAASRHSSSTHSVPPIAVAA